ncbi:S24 family peptidase [Neisseria elongata]|jgi:bacteriophage CI repressor helix-turn-helix domain|uniref:S24 family peptidase n=1 Tax=Neisseria elongata TaxID=495 RepID=UPI000E0D4CE5|nr:helix-turn-helix transcriptional regulator [Neisseria elongata]DAO14995.1 MAG TPA: Repressor protein CI [Caudoviricetes sp.]
MDTFKERLAYLWRDNLKPSAISKAIGMSQPGFSRIWYEGGLPNAETLIKIRESTGCDLNWLLTGKGSPYIDNDQAVEVRTHSDGTATDTLGNPVNLDEFVFIPRYDVYAAAGHGYPAEDDKPLFCMAFRRYWIENYVTRQIDKLSVIAVKGDSMEGVLNHGDNILVNHAETTPRDGLYVIRIDNDLFVKQIQKLPGKLLVKSSNPAYEPFEIDLNDDSQNVAIIGRVEWYGRTVN